MEPFRQLCPQAQLLLLDGSIDATDIEKARPQYEATNVLDFSACVRLKEAGLVSVLKALRPPLFPSPLKLFLPPSKAALTATLWPVMPRHRG